jgi:hypothetical protein
MHAPPDQFFELWCNIAPDDYWREYHHAQAKHLIHAPKMTNG